MLEIVAGDVRETLPAWGGRVDAWFLDGFAPAKNPEMWGEDVLRAVADRMVPGGTLATYSAAGFVRRALAEAGLEVSGCPIWPQAAHDLRAETPVTAQRNDIRLGIILMIATSLVFAGQTGCRGTWRANTTS